MSISQNFPEEGPSLNLNFASSKTLDPRITFTRTSSATYTDDNGLIRVAPANSPRFDHRYNPTTGEIESLGLLIEESRANLTTFSEQLDNARWATFDFTLSTNTTETTAPDGSNNAEKITETTGSSNHSFFNFNAYGVTAGSIYTASIFVKSVNKQFIQLVFDDNATINGGYVNFNLTSGTISASANYGTGTSIAGTITSYPNGWYRLSVTSTAGTTSTVARFSINGLTSGTSGAFPGYTGNTSNGYYIWGAQLEQGSFPTSYIPTTTSTATRTADNASMTGSNFTSWYNQNEGTIYTQFRCDNWNISKKFEKVFTINQSGSEDNGFWIGNDNIDSNVIRYRVRSSGINQFGPANITRTSNVVRSVISVKSSNFAVTVNGNIPTTSISGILPNTMNSLTIGRDIFGVEDKFLNGHISQLAYYPVRLTNSQLQTLTR